MYPSISPLRFYEGFFLQLSFIKKFHVFSPILRKSVIFEVWSQYTIVSLGFEGESNYYIVLSNCDSFINQTLTIIMY